MPLDDTTYIPIDPITRTNDLVSVLRAGRAHLKRYGWCQGTAFRDERTCLMGSIFAVTEGPQIGIVFGENSPREAACDALQLAIDQKLDWPTVAGFRSITFWNDQKGRTIDDIFEIYDIAIENAIKHQHR